jgi:hypothetical protein
MAFAHAIETLSLGERLKDLYAAGVTPGPVLYLGPAQTAH